MKRVFQWRRYFDWKNLTSEEKLTMKRLLFVPIIGYFIIGFIHQYALTFIFLILGFLAYKNYEKSGLKKK